MIIDKGLIPTIYRTLTNSLPKFHNAIMQFAACNIEGTERYYGKKSKLEEKG